MSKTSRALAIVAVAAPLISIGCVLWASHVLADLARTASPNGTDFSPSMFPLVWAPAVVFFAAPVIATFAVIVTARMRRWGWLAAFALLGLFAMIGLSPLEGKLPFLPVVDPLSVGPLEMKALLIDFGPLLLLAIVTLIYALTHRDDAEAPLANRTVGIVTVVALLVSAVSIAWTAHAYFVANGYAFGAFGLPIVIQGDPTLLTLDIPNYWWPFTNAIAAPVIATLAILTTAWSRRWVWLAVFIVLGACCVLGPGALFAYQLPLHTFPLGQNSNVTISPALPEVLPTIALAIAALIFAFAPHGHAAQGFGAEPVLPVSA